MGEIALTTINSLLQVIITTYLIILFSKSVDNKEYPIKYNFFIFFIEAVGIFLSMFGNFPTLIKMLLCAIPTFISLKFILKVNLLKTFIITIATFLIFAITESISVIILTSIFKFTISDIRNSLFLTLILIYIQLLIMFLLIKVIPLILAKHKKFNNIFNNIRTNQLFNLLIIILICILPKILIIGLNYYEYSTTFLLANLIETIVVVFLTFIFFKRTLERDKVQSELNLSEMHNKTMIGMVDGVRTLKHDYNNIIQALSGYVKTKQYDKLEEHINKVLQECNVVNNYSMITAETFNEPAVYGIMGAKYFIAVDKDITVDLDVSCDFTKISFPMPEFSRILGILLDNAIEATQKSSNKYIRFEARYDARKNADIIKVVNTYDTNINIDLNKIYEKGFSSKKIKSGIGLWEVKKLVKKNKNSQIYATIENGKFVQNLIIERLTEHEEFQNTTTKDTNCNMLIPLNK